MGERVNEACGQVIAETAIFPKCVREAAFRLKEFFGDRRFGSIGRDDFAAYVGKCTERDTGTEAFGLGGPEEHASYDLNILGTIAGFAGEIALWELIQMWIEERQPASPGARR